MIAENTALKDLVAELRHQLEWLKRQVFGQKTERYIPSDDNQLTLALGVPENDLPAKTETITYDRKKPQNNTPHGREEIPAHLPRNEIVIMPQEDVSGMERIGEKVTEQLEYTPPKYFVNKYVRPVFAGDIQWRTYRCLRRAAEALQRKGQIRGIDHCPCRCLQVRRPYADLSLAENNRAGQRRCHSGKQPRYLPRTRRLLAGTDCPEMR